MMLCRLGQYYRLSSQSDMNAYWIIQDVMATEALLCLVAQSVTMLVRGRTWRNILPSVRCSPECYYYAVVGGLLLLHIALILLIRGSSSSGAVYLWAEVEWPVWLVLFVLPVLVVVVGVLVNRLDAWHFQRFMQFLRLEFDTRLGMHSPK